MITPEERKELSISAVLQVMALGGAIPQPITGSGNSLSGRLARLGWKILPVPAFVAAGKFWHSSGGNGNPAHIDFDHTREWLIVPPEESGLRACKVEGKLRAIRKACRMAADEGGDDAAAPLG